VFSIYGSAEAETIGTECTAHDGFHLWEDHFLFEVVKAETDLLGDTEGLGELVLTTLTKKGMPLLRYRSGDIAELRNNPCSCGRTHRRIKVLGRFEESVRLRSGYLLHPYHIDAVLVDFPELLTYQLKVTKVDDKDIFRLLAVFDDTIGVSKNLLSNITNALSVLLVDRCRDSIFEGVEVVTISDLVRNTGGKVVRIIDERRN